MITFEVEKSRFLYRTGGVLIRDKSVLLNRPEQEAYWFMPGGRVEINERSEDAVLREMREETGLEMQVERLMWTSENFFTLQGRRHHEIAFYYLLSLRAEADYARLEAPFEIQDNGATVCYGWHKLDTLSDLELVPTFLKLELLRLPDTPFHIVHQDIMVSTSDPKESE
jgi:ADP-ribose pyrophosphatase YjhB (NUDIX family)